MFTLFFAISHGVRPISPGRSARSAFEPAQREIFGSFISLEINVCTSKSYGWSDFVSRLCLVGIRTRRRL